jgi:hypothetical protein
MPPLTINLLCHTCRTSSEYSNGEIPATGFGGPCTHRSSRNTMRGLGLSTASMI